MCEAIEQAQAAGIRVIMITGDHPATANAIARKVSIESDQPISGKALEVMDDEALVQSVKKHSVFARMAPEHKLKVVSALKKAGEIVAVTGDGVNDAPALKAADVGVAMGQRGSDVSRETADLILMDDNFSTIVSAIREGRSIYENIQKFIRTLFSTNLTEVILITIGVVIAFASFKSGQSILLPLTAVQILWVNLLTDSLPALALAMDKNQGVMLTKPRPPEAPLLGGSSLYFTLGAGVFGGITALLILIILPMLGYSPAYAQTLVFCYLVYVQLSFVLPARRVNLKPSVNALVYLSIIIGGGLQAVVMIFEPLRALLGLVQVDSQMFLMLVVMVFVSWTFSELLTKVLCRK